MQVESQSPELTTEDFVVMMHASRMCVLIHDAVTKNILWANPAACEMLEWSVTELRPLKADDMSSSARQYNRVLGRAWLQEAAERGTNRVEWHYRSKSGRVIPTDAVAVRVELSQGTALMVQFRDIEREQAVERQLRLTTSWVDALGHYTSTAAFMLDSSGAIRFATDTATTLIGAADAERLDKVSAYGRLRIDGRICAWDEVHRRATPTTTVQLEIPGDTDSEPVWLEGSLERLATGDGDALLMILHNVSERVQGELRRERELHRENYLARYTAMGDMAMAIAHELGQPLAAAGNFLAGARSDARATAPRVIYGIDNAVRQIERAATIVRSVRAFVGHLEQIDQVADLNDIVEECLYFVRLRAAPAGVNVVAALSETPVNVRCERVLTGQVVLNLCFNAIDEMVAASPQRRRLTITTGTTGDAGLVTVDDEGQGLEHDPFTRTFTSKEHGSGIGLALSYRIITRQHGTMWAEALGAGGSRFGFTLPFAPD